MKNDAATRAAEDYASGLPNNLMHTVPLLADIIRQHTRPDLGVKLARSLKDILPLAESYLSKATTHPDNAKLEDARCILKEAELWFG